MNKKKFRVTVTQQKEIDVEIDVDEMSEEWMAEFRKSFYNYETLEEHARQIARMAALDLTSQGNFFEGYGYLRIANRLYPEGRFSYEAQQNPDYPRMNITVREESGDVDTEVEEL